jgi:hypothetical protein
MREANKPNWHIFTGTGIGEAVDGMVFLPYLYGNAISKIKNPKKILNQGELIAKSLPEGKYLFCHHAISDMDFGGMSTNMLTEVLLPHKILNEKYNRVFGGHIHSRSDKDRVHVVGSVFTHNSGDGDKWICILEEHEKGSSVEWRKLPCRHINTLTGPDLKAVKALEKDSIAKVIFTDRELIPSVQGIKEALVARKINFKILEQFREQRVKKEEDLSVVDLSIEKLLKIYADQKKVSFKALMEGFDIVK